MKAFGFAAEGASAGFIEIPTPDPGPGEIRVRVRASSVNGYDVYVATGMARGSTEHRYPVVVGKDYAGVVEALGEGVTRLAEGDEVVGIVPPEPHLQRGAYAETVVVPAEGFIERKPGNVGFEEAGSIGLAGLTALVAVDVIDPARDELVLISGAAGGVGGFAVQMAAARGAHVIATGLPEDMDRLSALGASETVDYSSDEAAAVREKHPEGIDGLIVAVPLGDAFASVAGLVKDGGRIATATGSSGEEALEERGVSILSVFWGGDPSGFERLVRLVAEGSVSVPVTEIFGFEEIPQALGLVGKRHSRGKFAITIGG